MARVRSPNYPAIGLSEAIDRIKKVHSAQHQALEPREVVAQHMGYGSLNGAALKTLSALIKYGLLIKTGKDELKVSDRAMIILFPENPGEREEAIRDAAAAPTLFAEISERWEGKPPSDESLRSYLSRRHFAQPAIGSVIQSYRETIDLVTRESEGHDSVSDGEPNEGAKMQEATIASTPRSMPAALIEKAQKERERVKDLEGQYEVSMIGSLISGMTVVGRFALKDQNSVDNFIKILDANKSLLPKSAKIVSDSEDADGDAAN